MTSDHYAPYAQGIRGHTMGRTAGSEVARRSKSLKPTLSSDRSLELDCVKAESLVMADQHAAVNVSLFLALTARQTMGAEAL